MRQTDEPERVDTLLDYLTQTRGFNFAGYKRASVLRRIRRRMQTIEIEDYNDYLDYLQVHPEEFAHLFNTILINVTSFFRDAWAWDYLASDIVPAILARKARGEPIRIWSAGCASGEEAYTLAIVLAEAMGAEAFREQVKIYATDLDEEALTQARMATYSARQVTGVPPDLLSKYFEPVNSHYAFLKELRRGVIFGRHNLMQDAPISRVDLLVCRNTLMYFNSEVQDRILSRFHYALQDDGYLFLGRAEMLFAHTDAFMPVDLRCRIFTKAQKSANRLYRALPRRIGRDGVSELSPATRLQEAAFEQSPVAQIVLDRNNHLIMVSEAANTLFNLSAHDLGRPLQDLQLSYRPVELRSCLERVFAEKRTLVIKEVEWAVGLESRYLDVQIVPLTDADGHSDGALVSYTDITLHKRLDRELQQTNQELETAYEELQSASEELETTNEELQSTVEELETTNEELQSTNEELETINEELQSTNEELQTINGELRERSDQLKETHRFTEAIMAGLHVGVIVMDAELQIIVWNDRAQDLWGWRADEVRGKNFLNLDIGLPVAELRQPLRECLNGDSVLQERTLPAMNRRGKNIVCRVSCSPLGSQETRIQGAIVVVEEVTTP